MKIEEAFDAVELVFLDTAPVIYYVEKNPDYFAVAKRVFDLIKNEANSVGSGFACDAGRMFSGSSTK
jgi:hypothetical protein